MRPGIELDNLIRKHIFNDEYQIARKFYSENIEDAWEVVEKVCADRQEKLNEFMVKKLAQGGTVQETFGDYVATYKEGGDYVPGVSAPHAICLAALKAKGVEI